MAAAAPVENGNMKSFTDQLDQARIEHAIAAAERLTSGEIRVVIAPGRVSEPLKTAEAEFARLGMHHTHARNAVLIFVAPDSRSFVVFGDRAVHEKCRDAFWREVAQAMEVHFKAGAFTAAVIEGIERAGKLLAAEFPRQPGDRNELPDGVVTRPRLI